MKVLWSMQWMHPVSFCRQSTSFWKWSTFSEGGLFLSEGGQHFLKAVYFFLKAVYIFWKWSVSIWRWSVSFRIGTNVLWRVGWPPKLQLSKGVWLTRGTVCYGHHVPGARTAGQCINASGSAPGTMDRHGTSQLGSCIYCLHSCCQSSRESGGREVTVISRCFFTVTTYTDFFSLIGMMIRYWVIWALIMPHRILNMVYHHGQ